MENQPEPSISEWILGAKRGEPEAIGRLWHCYFEKLVRLARKRLADSPQRAADGEDVALSVFASFCQAAEKGRFPQLEDRSGLWRLLIRMTAQKAVNQARHDRRAKRGGGKVRGESGFRRTDGSGIDEGPAQVVGDSPTPEFAAQVAEQCARLLALLNDDLRPIALAKMEDCTNQEIAARLECSVSTVERGLRVIRKIWKQELERSGAT